MSIWILKKFNTLLDAFKGFICVYLGYLWYVNDVYKMCFICIGSVLPFISFHFIFFNKDSCYVKKKKQPHADLHFSLDVFSELNALLFIIFLCL